MDLTKGGALTELIAEVTWDQPQHGGILGGLRNRAGRTDVDLSAIIFAGGEPIDYADPKTHPIAQDGAVAHSGDAKTSAGGGEAITLKLTELDDDITAVAFVISCATGRFDKITNTKVTFRSADGAKLGTQRFSVTTDDNGAAIGYVTRAFGSGTWTYQEQKRYGRVDYARLATGQGWRQLADIAQRAVLNQR